MTTPDPLPQQCEPSPFDLGDQQAEELRRLRAENARLRAVMEMQPGFRKVARMAHLQADLTKWNTERTNERPPITL